MKERIGHYWNDLVIAPITGQSRWRVWMYDECIGYINDFGEDMQVCPVATRELVTVGQRCTTSVHRAALFLAELATRPEKEAA